MSKQHDALTAAQLPRNNKIDYPCVIVKRPHNKLEILGPHGSMICRNDQPMEIGAAVTEVLLGKQICPPTRYQQETTNEGEE